MSNLCLLDPVFSDSFDNVMRRFLAPMAFDMEPAPLLKMRVDVTENDQAYEVKADIPGVKKDDINVRIDGNVVQIDAEARSEKETKGNGDKVIRSERYQGTVSRTFSLACDIDEGKVDARYADGVLTLKLPKKGTRFQVDLLHQDWSGNCLLMCNAYTKHLTMDGDGRFVQGGYSVGGWPGIGASWASIPADQRGTYAVVATGIIELSYDSGTRERHVVGVEHDLLGRPNPAVAGMLLGSTNFY